MEASAVIAERTAYEHFLTTMAYMSAIRGDKPSQRLYEQWKRDFVRDVPDATPEQYQAAMQEVARAAGV